MSFKLVRPLSRCCSPVLAGWIAPLRSVMSRSFQTSAFHLQKQLPQTSTSLFNPKDTSKPFFVTTPIFYVNASPHIGHLHSLVLTDVLARYAKLRNPNRQVIFTTGTDEHGLKIQQAAKAQGIEEEAFCAGVSQRFRDLADKANIGYTDFIRTSEERHYRAVEHFWNKLVESGNLYKGTHSGWYSISDECFYSQTQVDKDPQSDKMIATETGNEVIWEQEENWKFRLDKFREPLLDWVKKVESVSPESMRGYVASAMETAEELSVSRPKSRVKWGVPVPGDPDQTIYVWVDALINYLTVLGYPDSHTGWPADVHVVGKDIIKFHAIHWPALLMSAGVEPPRTVLSHAHWTMGKSKMSKSRGNVVDPIAAIDIYGPDSIRWYLMRAGGSLPTDSDYSGAQLSTQYTILASQIGNLVTRILSPKICGKMGKVTDEHPLEQVDESFRTVRDQVDERMEGFQVMKACELIIELLHDANKIVTDMEPWKMKDTTIPVLYAYTALRLAGILLQPIMPAKSLEVLDRLGVAENERTWEHAVWSGRQGVNTASLRDQLKEASEIWKGKGHLFPRIEEEVSK